MNTITRDEKHGNINAEEGCTRCVCGCKYWENDRCIDCGLIVEMAELRQRTVDAKLAAKMWLSWQTDILRVRLGQAEVVEWPTQRIERHLRRGVKPAAAMPEGTRLVFHAGQALLVRDIVITES